MDLLVMVCRVTLGSHTSEYHGSTTALTSDAKGKGRFVTRHAPTAHAWASKQPSLHDCHPADMCMGLTSNP